jgi:hypothetical protein
MTNTPRGLGTAGKRLWASVTADYELDPVEVEVLREAANTLDELDTINRALRDAPATVSGSKGQPVTNPLFAEARAHRLVLNKLLGSLDLPDGEEQPESWTTVRARAAAQARWRGEREAERVRRHGTA